MTRRRGIAELLLFFAAAGIGVYAFGRGLAGFFGIAHPDPLWLLPAFAALWVLGRQMSRIQDRWPRRKPPRQRQPRRAPASDTTRKPQ